MASMLKHLETTDLVLKAFYNVYHVLGYGFLERVYQQAMMIELGKLGAVFTAQAPLRVYYDGQLVGEYVADLVVADAVIVELKAVTGLAREHEAQLLNYLKATRFEVGLLLNFGPKPQFVRKVFDNERKGSHAWLKSETWDAEGRGGHG